MKIIKTVFFVLFISLIFVSSVNAESNPPKPTMNSVNSTTEGSDGPPAPDYGEVPIDTNIVFLLVAGLLIGFVVICKNKIKKASM